jgi:hypothetical protein
MSGRDLARWFREKRPDVKVLSSSGFADIVQDEVVAGPDVKLLRKPYKQAELARAVRQEPQPVAAAPMTARKPPRGGELLAHGLGEPATISDLIGRMSTADRAASRPRLKYEAPEVCLREPCSDRTWGQSPIHRHGQVGEGPAATN